MVIFGKGVIIMGNEIEHGTFTISDYHIHIFGTTLSLDKIDNMENLVFSRRSIFSNLGTWFVGFIIMLIISCINHDLMILGDIYCYSLIVLIIYNIYMFTKQYFGIKIQTSAGKTIIIKSENKEFIYKIHDTILEAIKSKKANYTINMDNHNIINNGIISEGDSNKNTISKE